MKKFFSIVFLCTPISSMIDPALYSKNYNRAKGSLNKALRSGDTKETAAYMSYFKSNPLGLDSEKAELVSAAQVGLTHLERAQSERFPKGQRNKAVLGIAQIGFAAVSFFSAYILTQKYAYHVASEGYSERLNKLDADYKNSLQVLSTHGIAGVPVPATIGYVAGVADVYASKTKGAALYGGGIGGCLLTGFYSGVQGMQNIWTASFYKTDLSKRITSQQDAIKELKASRSMCEKDEPLAN